MTLLEFARQVRDLRTWQRRFFAAPAGSADKSEALRESKAREAEVDAAVGAVLSGRAQGDLFAPKESPK